VVSNLNDLENHEVAQKVLKYKERKAKNQRRYYQKYVHLSISLRLSYSRVPSVTNVFSKKWDAEGRLSASYVIFGVTPSYRHRRNRLLAKKTSWMRNGDHDQDHLTSTNINTHTPTLVPVFDPVFFTTRIVLPVKRFNPALQHVFSVNLRGTVSIQTQDSMAV
jgi:hypothetical protein